VAEVLLCETDYFLAEAEKAVDLETFGADVWPGVKLGDSAKSKLTTVFRESFSEFLPEYIGYYITQTDRDLKLEQVSKRTLAWVESWSKELGAIMQLTSHREIESILEKGIAAGTGVAEFTRAIRGRILQGPARSCHRGPAGTQRRPAGGVYAIPGGQREDVEAHRGIPE